MARTPPPPHPRGTARTPGSGRKKGTANRKTIELRALLGSLCHDIDYQDRLRRDFRLRRVHPAIESLAWGHVIGKPAERVQLSADVAMNQKLDTERELFNKLDVQQLEELAAESQALVDKAFAMAKANAGTGAAPAPRALAEHGMSSDALGPNGPGTVVARLGDGDRSLKPDGAETGALPISVSMSPAAGVEDVAASEPTGQSMGPIVADERNSAGTDTFLAGPPHSGHRTQDAADPNYKLRS